MKVAYIFMSDHAREILENMILPQMEAGVHGADVVGMVFFFDNAYMLHKDSEIGKRLAALSEEWYDAGWLRLLLPAARHFQRSCFPCRCGMLPNHLSCFGRRKTRSGYYSVTG